MIKQISSRYVYLAGPLLGAGEPSSHNINSAIRDGMRLAEAGYTPFIPHLFHFADLVCPHELDFWYRLDRDWLKKCGAMVRRKGVSAGSDLEEVWARELRIPVWHGVEAFLSDMPVVERLVSQPVGLGCEPCVRERAVTGRCKVMLMREMNLTEEKFDQHRDLIADSVVLAIRQEGHMFDRINQLTMHTVRKRIAERIAGVEEEDGS
jgi:hypothetical protein